MIAPTRTQKLYRFIAIAFLGLSFGCSGEGASDAVAPQEDIASFPAEDISTTDVGAVDLSSSPPLDSRTEEDTRESTLDVPEVFSELDTTKPETEDTASADEGSGVDIEETSLCDPPLSLDPGSAISGSQMYLVFSPSGGTGAYRFEFKENNSEAILNQYTGAYLSGTISNVVDSIVLTDDACEGEATANIDVVGDPEVLPAGIEIPPGSCLQFEVLYGSGSFNWMNLSVEPAGTLSADGFYLAGEQIGEDLLRVEDAITGRVFDFDVQITADSQIRGTTQSLLMSTGSSYAVPLESGSGAYESSVEGESVIVSDGIVSSISIGAANITVYDSIVGCIGGDELSDHPEVLLDVKVDHSLKAPTQVGGGGQRGAALPAGDLNGDGFPDAVLGIPWSNFGGVNSGAVFVYPGGQEGFNTEAVEAVYPPIKNGYFGREIALGDVNGDGQTDLVASSFKDDGEYGAVFLFHGVEDGFFEEEAAWSKPGDKDDDRLGTAVALCDFNGDGWLDLAVGAEFAEDESSGIMIEVGPEEEGEENPGEETEPVYELKVQEKQGLVQVFLGGETGFAENPNLERFGAVFEEASWIPETNLYFGSSLIAGDFNHDNRCDLAVGARGYGAAEGNSEDGALYLYVGTEDGLSESPAMGWAGMDPDNKNSRFGQFGTVADVDNDGLTDLVATAIYYDAEGKSNAGAVHVFLGSTELPENFEMTADMDADWTGKGNGGNDLWGVWVQVADADGDGNPDILVGAQADEITGGTGGTGSVVIYEGQENTLPKTTPGRTIAGFATSDQFGKAFAAVEDLNGDGFAEILSLASVADSIARDVGAVYEVMGTPFPAIYWGETWRYQDLDEAPADDWRTLDYDDSLWLEGEGQIGFGDNDESTVMENITNATPTVYFRKVINLETAPAYSELSIMHDDGVVIWVNETEIFRDRVDNGLEHDVKASSHTSDDQIDIVKLAGASGEVITDVVDSPWVQGENIIAVMLKQASGQSADLSFDMQLRTAPSAQHLENPTEEINFPQVKSGSQFGRAVTFIDDITGDGRPDLLVGAPVHTPSEYREGAGSVFLYPGEDAGFARDPIFEWRDFTLFETSDPSNNSGTNLGWALSSGGDFNNDGIKDFAFMARSKAQPKSYTDAAQAAENCEKSISAVGAVYLFNQSNHQGDPFFAYFAPYKNQRLRSMATGFDYNGDGFDDLVVGSESWDVSGQSNAGGVAFIQGRASAEEGSIEVVCEADFLVRGRLKNDYVGRAVAGLGDLNGDGCDEVAVGASGEDHGKSSQGAVYIFYGWGDTCAYSEPHTTQLVPESANADSGWALEGKLDVDGDDLPDLLVGGPDYRNGSVHGGALWILRGSYLAKTALAPLPLENGELPVNPELFPFTPEDETARMKVMGKTHNGDLGTSVAYLSAPEEITESQGITAYVAAGGPLLGDSGSEKSGGAHVYAFYGAQGGIGFDPVPLMSFGGESYRKNGRLGDSLDLRWIEGELTIAIGGYDGTPFDAVERISDGSVYIFTAP